MNMFNKILLVAVAGFVVGNSSIFAAGKLERLTGKEGSSKESPSAREERMRAHARVAKGLPAYVEEADLSARTDDGLTDFGFMNFDLEPKSNEQVFKKPVIQIKVKTVADKPWYRGFCQIVFTWMSASY